LLGLYQPDSINTGLIYLIRQGINRRVVRIKPLDKMLHDISHTLLMIKVNVEESEYHVLKGMINTLREGKARYLIIVVANESKNLVTNIHVN